MTARFAAWKVCVVVSMAGCGAEAPQMRVTSPFTAEHAQVFDDGVDYVARPDALDGDWREDWEQEMQKRVAFADVVTVVSVRTMRQDTDLDRRTTYRLVGTVERSLLGDPGESEIELVVREGSESFATVDGNDRRILNRTFVAFLKWYATPSGAIAPHWHLSPASQPILEWVRRLVDRRTRAQRPEQREIVIEHSN